MPKKPHECPSCGGRQPAKDSCDTCDRTGVVWEPDAAEEAAEAPTSANNRDLTSRPR